jgi:hypothetical protein
MSGDIQSDEHKFHKRIVRSRPHNLTYVRRSLYAGAPHIMSTRKGHKVLKRLAAKYFISMVVQF